MENPSKAVLSGRAWCLGDDVDTDLIIPARYLSIRDLSALAEHTLEPVLPEFARNVRPGDLIVAGENFGSGSSREHAVLTLKQLGVAAIICASAARTFYRNAFNNGLPVVECPGLSREVNTGDALQLDLAGGRIVKPSTGAGYPIEPIPPFMHAILTAGGLVPYLRQQG